MSTMQTRPSIRPALEEHAADSAPQDVLFATDGGEAGHGALKWLAHRSTMHRLNVHVLTVVETDVLPDRLQQSRLLEAADAALAEATEYLARTAPSAEVTTSVAWGEPRSQFATASQEADLLVVGSNRTGALSGVFGASFSTKLVEAALCPVVVVPKKWHAGHGPVVVGILGDGSDEAALRFAVREATILHRELRVVHAWDFPPVVAPTVLDDGTTLVVDSHDTLLADTVGRLRAENPLLAVRGALLEGHPAAALTREAEGAEMLVVGSHGWTVMDRFFIGSISRDILGHPTCPVAVVRPFGKEDDR